MKKIIFFNYFHNGDIHSSRLFVKDIMIKLNVGTAFYYHELKDNILDDLNITKTDIKPNNDELYYEDDDYIYINTWFHVKYGHRYHQCTIESLYYNFTIIYKNLGIELDEISKYIPKIDYSKFKIDKIDNYFNDLKYEKYIFISNGDIKSFQSDPSNMDFIIDYLSENDKYLVIISNESNIIKNNVISSKIIIGYELDNDLNENSYISTKCDIIIGRESGPYFFSYVVENVISEKEQIIIQISYVKPFLNENYYNKQKNMYRLNNTSSFIPLFEKIK